MAQKRNIRIATPRGWNRCADLQWKLFSGLRDCERVRNQRGWLADVHVHKRRNFRIIIEKGE